MQVREDHLSGIKLDDNHKLHSIWGRNNGKVEATKPMQCIDGDTIYGDDTCGGIMILPSSHSLSQWGRLAENLGEVKFLWDDNRHPPDRLTMREDQSRAMG